MDYRPAHSMSGGSSPVEGVQKAIRSFYDPKKKISLYVMGDDFKGIIRRVVRTIDRLNRERKPASVWYALCRGLPGYFCRYPCTYA